MTCPAGCDAGYEDFLADGEIGDGGTERVDDPNALVAENSACFCSRDVAGEDMQVCAADCCVQDADYCVGGVEEGWFRPLLDGDLVRGFVDDSFHYAG